MTTVIGYLDYVDGYIRSAHKELDLNDEELEEFEKLTTSEKIERLYEDGDLVIDGYRINYYGGITEIEY